MRKALIFIILTATCVAYSGISKVACPELLQPVDTEYRSEFVSYLYNMATKVDKELSFERDNGTVRILKSSDQDYKAVPYEDLNPASLPDYENIDFHQMTTIYKKIPQDFVSTYEIKKVEEEFNIDGFLNSETAIPYFENLEFLKVRVLNEFDKPIQIAQIGGYPVEVRVLYSRTDIDYETGGLSPEKSYEVAHKLQTIIKLSDLGIAPKVIGISYNKTLGQYYYLTAIEHGMPNVAIAQLREKLTTTKKEESLRVEKFEEFIDKLLFSDISSLKRGFNLDNQAWRTKRTDNHEFDAYEFAFSFHSDTMELLTGEFKLYDAVDNEPSTLYPELVRSKKDSQSVRYKNLLGPYNLQYGDFVSTPNEPESKFGRITLTRFEFLISILNNKARVKYLRYLANSKPKAAKSLFDLINFLADIEKSYTGKDVPDFIQNLIKEYRKPYSIN